MTWNETLFLLCKSAKVLYRHFIKYNNQQNINSQCIKELNTSENFQNMFIHSAFFHWTKVLYRHFIIKYNNQQKELNITGQNCYTDISSSHITNKNTPLENKQKRHLQSEIEVLYNIRKHLTYGGGITSNDAFL